MEPRGLTRLFLFLQQEVHGMWIKNTKTGHVWFVSEGQGKRLIKTGVYEVTEAPKAKTKRSRKSDVNEQSE